MYFKRLELVGFKSFPNKTTIQFEPGVTAIVGPNGCGKSNVSDAIRWVLGEQSAKSLRGSSMEDVIFNGSSAKEPVNFAEVSLTLSNESKILAIDYDEVTITRRLYRSGDSEYLLNKNTVRLKDIHELLMGTGIGTESYSVIEQGKMDMILNSKPEERRMIFEEAAGITKFKSKKKEALRKLEQTDTNLLRINDIIQEVKRSIGSIERQAKKAESYKIEFEKLKKLELGVASREFISFESNRKDKEGNLEALKNQEAEYLSVMTAVEDRFNEKKDKVQELDNTLRSADSQNMKLEGDIRRNQDRILLNRERIGELFERKENQSKQLAMANKRLEELSAEYDSLNTEYETVKHEEIQGASFLGSVEQDFHAIDHFVKTSNEDEKNFKLRLMDLANQRAHQQTELARIHAELDGTRARLHRVREEESTFRKDEEELLSGIAILKGVGSSGLPWDAWISDRIGGLKKKLKDFFRAWSEKNRADLEEPEEHWLDAELKGFADEISHVQAEDANKKEKLAVVEDRKRKLLEELATVNFEITDLTNVEKDLSEKARQHEETVGNITREEQSLTEKLASIESLKVAKQSEKDGLLVRLAETRERQNHCTARREKIEKDRGWVLETKMNQESQILILEKESQEAVSKKEVLETESAELEKELESLAIQRDDLLRSGEGLRHDLDTVREELGAIEKEKDEKEIFLRTVRDKIHGFELENAEIRFEIDRLKERIYNAYQIDLMIEGAIQDTNAEALEAFGAGEAFDLENAKGDIQAQKDKLNKMGPVNLVAIQEYDEMKERYDFLTKQQQDLVQAKEDLHQAILKINRTTRELFVETFESIQKNFTEYYRLLFGGGTAELVLMDENDVLECGIEIVARPPGKRLQNITLLSGGEKALTAVALLFALFKVKPSPFCILDEIDAPLDESNVDRFCNVLTEFIRGSQFILITHNKRTMNLADVMYGITMGETGVSKVVSVKFSEKAGQNHKEEKKEVLV